MTHRIGEYQGVGCVRLMFETASPDRLGMSRRIVEVIHVKIDVYE